MFCGGIKTVGRRWGAGPCDDGPGVSLTRRATAERKETRCARARAKRVNDEAGPLLANLYRHCKESSPFLQLRRQPGSELSKSL